MKIEKIKPEQKSFCELKAGVCFHPEDDEDYYLKTEEGGAVSLKDGFLYGFRVDMLCVEVQAILQVMED